MNDVVFDVDDTVKKKLHLYIYINGECFEQKIRDIFAEAKKLYGKDVLTIDEITKGYYILFTSKEKKGKVITKGNMNSRLFYYFKKSKHKFLDSTARGKWRLCDG